MRVDKGAVPRRRRTEPSHRKPGRSNVAGLGLSRSSRDADRSGRDRQGGQRALSASLRALERCLASLPPRLERGCTLLIRSLGRYRWVVERTFAWLHNFKRLLVRYERRADMHHADMHHALLALG